VVTVAHLEPPIIVQNRRNKQSFNTYAYTLTVLHFFRRKYDLQTRTRKQVKIHKIKKKAQCRIRILGMRKGEEKEKPNNST
jgi:hypothetical protein